MSETTTSQRALLGLPEFGDAPTAPVVVSIERGRVQPGRLDHYPVTGSVEVNLRSGNQTIYDIGCGKYHWPFNNAEVQHLRCEHLLEYLTSIERIAFIEECGRVLKVSGTLLVTFYYATSRQASADPMFQWPPLTEFSFNYFNRNWRAENGCTYPIACDFDFVYKLDLDASMSVRHNEAKNFSTKHYNQSVIKMHGLMTKRS